MQQNDLLRFTLTAFSAGMIGAAIGACGEDDEARPYPYGPGETRIIDSNPYGNVDPDGDLYETFGTPSGESCLDGPAGEFCIQPQETCGEDATADVILDEAGNVLSTICYPNHDDVQFVPLDGTVEDPVLDNNTVLVIDGADDGADVIGDVTIEGNNSVIYGQGPDTSIIDGSLAIEKNNAIVRGVRITGDATITKNNAALIYCVIEGDLTITGNNVSLALCEVWGEVTIAGNNTVFVSNLVAGEQPIEGMNLQCNDNLRFADDNDDGVVDEDEIGEAVACGSRDDIVEDDPSLIP